jgi:hypothetical protein
MKNYILGFLLSVFVFITVHDYIIAVEDYDTQTELIMEASGQLDFEQMCKISQIHDCLHEMLIAANIEETLHFSKTMIKTQKPLFHNHFYIDFFPGNLYRPPIA